LWKCWRKRNFRKKLIIFKQNEEISRISTVIIRAATESLLNDLERVVDNGVNFIKSICRKSDFVCGSGAIEIELSKQIQNYSSTCPGLDQYAIKKFGEAFEIIPRTLAENSGQDSTEVLSLLYASHANNNVNDGINIEDGGILNSNDNEIYDSIFTKETGIKYATDAVTTILRIDQIIMSKPAGGPKPRQGGNPDDDL